MTLSVCRQQYTLYVLCDCDTKDLPKARARVTVIYRVLVQWAHSWTTRLWKLSVFCCCCCYFYHLVILLIYQSQSDRYDLLTFATSWSWKKIHFVYLDVEFSVVMWHISISCRWNVSPTENSASTWLESTFCKNQPSNWSHRHHPLETFTPSSWTKWTNLSQSERHLIISAKLNGDAEANGFISQIQQATWYLSFVQPAGVQQKEEFPKWQLVSGQSSHWAPLASRLSPAALFHSSLTNWSQLIPNVPSSWILKSLSEIKVFHQNLDSKAAAAEDTEHKIQLLWTPRGSNRTTLCLWGLW